MLHPRIQHALGPRRQPPRKLAGAQRRSRNRPCPDVHHAVQEGLSLASLREKGKLREADGMVKALKKTHVNIVDLIDCRRAGTAVRRFPTYGALRAYTVETGKVFPREAAKEEGFVKVLLREIF